MADKRALFEAKINEAGKGPGFERVDHGPNFKPGWKANGNSGGGHTGTTSSPLTSINITDHSCAQRTTASSRSRQSASRPSLSTYCPPLLDLQ